MGPGILVRYSKQVLGGLLAVFVIAAALLYVWFRSPIAGVSPHETVNDLYEWEYMTFEAEDDGYSSDVDTIRLYFRNGAPDGVVCLSSRAPTFAYELEYLRDGVWHQMRPVVKSPQWGGAGGFSATNIVNWNGGEITLCCEIARDYPTPLRAGRYRIVIPDCEHMDGPLAALAAEFEVS